MDSFSYAGSRWASVVPFQAPTSTGPRRHRINQNDSSQFENSHMIASARPIA
jgi:hypothetical protein